tara:strand:+ start:438 stop:656 length:219 start_codon:yes stop_codon:yes gene_type:complete
MVANKALQLLAKAISDLEGNEKKVADALVAELQASNIVFGEKLICPINTNASNDPQYPLDLTAVKRDSQTLH